MNDTDVINVTIDRGRHVVLVVDDNAATRYSTSRVLRAGGFQVAEAASGLEAIEKSSQGVSAVVLDVHLPDTDGFEVCRRIRAHPATEHLPVVHLSATHVASEDRVTGLNAGADAYMLHPAEPAVMIATLQALIRARTAEDKLRRSEQRFRAIYDQAQSGIALLDARGFLVDANAAMQRLLGRDLHGLAGHALASFARPEVAAEVDRHARNTSWHGEFPMLRPDGETVFLDWSVSEAIEEGLRIAVVTDMSDRHELEQRRRDLLEREQVARASAEQHSRTKDDFIAVLSHELRTPLNSIVGWVAILMRRSPSPDTVKGLEAIERNVKAQARIISDILDVSRINSGKLRLELEDVDPSEVVANALGALQKEVADKDIQLQVDLSAPGARARMDPSRFEQVVWNLMTNAIKFSARGGKVHVRLRREGQRLKLAVRDEGLGIAPEFVPRLFDRFSQSDAPENRRHGGLGLGLSIVSHLVDLHGGTVKAHSDGLGLGATMTVDLPAYGPGDATAGHGHAELPGTPDDPDAGMRPLEGLDVLVVEDDVGAAEMLSVVLSDRGAVVRTAADYDAALGMVHARWPDLVVSDIGLPGRDGNELIRAIRALPVPPGRGPRLPAIALTAFARPEDRAKALEAGFDAHLAKPLKPHVLVAAMLAIAPARISTSP